MLNVKMVTEDKYKPAYAHDTDACMDIKAKINEENPICRNVWEYIYGTENPYPEKVNEITIKPNEVVKIHTGLQVDVPKGYIMQMFVRSSIGINKNLCLANGTGIIDNGYKDEIMIALYNFGNRPVIIKDGERICQFVILPRPQINAIFVQDDENFRQGDRGGGIGSTGV